jgi:hypothetical protein
MAKIACSGMSPVKKKIALIVGLISVFAGGTFCWWYSLRPILVVYVDADLSRHLDHARFKRVYREAGVWRIRMLEGEPTQELGEAPGEVRIALKLSQDWNPKLDEEMRARGYTGPGYTDLRTGIAYHPDIKKFLAKHRAKFQKAGLMDWEALERGMITNTAIHEGWHAIAQSTSHNARDPESVMYENPSGAALNYCSNRMKFTAGHRDRLRDMFAPKYPW